MGSTETAVHMRTQIAPHESSVKMCMTFLNGWLMDLHGMRVKHCPISTRNFRDWSDTSMASEPQFLLSENENHDNLTC